MRARRNGLVKVRAISGTSVVFLAFDMKAADAEGLMGFAIQRTDHVEDETVWLRGVKTFASVRPATGFDEVSSREHPFQVFQWADYTAKPGYTYTYRVVPMYGTPGALEARRDTKVTIETEPLQGFTHDVHFNRGAIASQAFAKRFPGLTLDQAGEPAYAWLARDLLPGILAFIERAADASWSLHVAIYEMKWPPVLEALREAVDRGAKVEVVYHAVDDETGRANEEAIHQAGLGAICTGRRNAKLMHNKFLVLSRRGTPLSTWVGSTNWSRNAFHGQLNVGHAMHDTALSRQFLSYWRQLARDPEAPALKDWTEEANPIPPDPDDAALMPVFSPRRGRAVLDWWIQLASAKGKALFMTFPFGIVKDFRPVFAQDDQVLRFALLDKYVNGGNAASREAAIEEIIDLRRRPNVGMALGERIGVHGIDGWMKESHGIGNFVDWVHTKFMLVDPLGPKPVTLTGSANWSEASVKDNDEHLVVVRGDTRVADIYFGEFMRLFAHHRFRESVARHVKEHGDAAFETWKPQDLFEDWRKWVPKHFEPGSEHDIKRRYFVGPR